VYFRRYTLSQTEQQAQLLLRRADFTTLSGIAVLHADDGYFRHGHFGGSLVGGMVLIFIQVAPTLMIQEVRSLRG